jgi:hypothetical protein
VNGNPSVAPEGTIGRFRLASPRVALLLGVLGLVLTVVGVPLVLRV